MGMSLMTAHRSYVRAPGLGVASHCCQCAEARLLVMMSNCHFSTVQTIRAISARVGRV
jgi:hypothetical protein